MRGGDAKDDAILRATIDLGHQLGLRVVAEGVEDDAAMARLAALGCQHLQGYGIGKPIPHEQFLPWLSQRRRVGHSSVVPLPGLAADAGTGT
jgi:EAL domain-containing protein (putative c-di-GMP-specific phosphodiesterase class I)